MKNKILLADDEEGIVTMLKNYFEMLGCLVCSVYDGKEALEKVACQPDIILLDTNMPKIDGISVCRRIREHASCPILFLTARIKSKDKIIGFQDGENDYIVKTFDIEELGARVKTHLRRKQRKQGKCAARFFNELAVDYLKCDVTVNNNLTPLSKKVFEVVELLSMNPGQVFDRERIYKTIWGIDGSGSSDTIMEHIRKIRSKLAVYTRHSYIDTVWGVGYKWSG